MFKIRFLLFLFALTTLSAYGQLPTKYWKIPRSIVDRYFSIHFSSNDLDRITVNERGNSVVYWSQHPSNANINKNFEEYILINENFKILSYSFDSSTKNYIDETLTQRAWLEIPEGVDVPKTVKQTVLWENFSNQLNQPTNRHSPICFKLVHYEIPVRLLSHIKTAKYIDADILKLMRKKNEYGEDVILWPINPEDSKYYKKVQSFLSENKIDYKRVRKMELIGFLTASRSIFVFDPKTKIITSFKVGTDRTGGIWHKKEMKYHDINFGRHVSNHLYNTQKHFNFRVYRPLLETMGFYIGSKGLTVSVREYPKDFLTGKRYLLPGFSAVHQRAGREIAEKNGSHDPGAFWRKHYNTRLAYAIGELSVFAGMAYESAHGQQFLIELDENFHPTGKIYARDLIDCYYFNAFFNHSIGKSHNMGWDSKYIHEQIYVRFGVFKSIWAPSWIFSPAEQEKIKAELSPNILDIPETYDEDYYYRRDTDTEDRNRLEMRMVNKEDIWVKEFYNVFEGLYQTVTGVDINRYKTSLGSGGSTETYITHVYLDNPVLGKIIGVLTGSSGTNPHTIFAHHLSNVPCFQGAEKNERGISCKKILDNIENQLDNLSYLK